MKNGNDQFGQFTRIWLSMLLAKGKSYREIGKEMGKHHSSIGREVRKYSIKVNGILRYDPQEAQRQSDLARRKSKGNKIDQSMELMNFIEEKLQAGWSPDAISGDLKRNHPHMKISHEAIYLYIYKFKREWIKFLPRGKDRRSRRKSLYESRTKTKIPDRTSINRRPESINDRNTFGHFEADCIVTKKSKYSLLVITERKTRWTKIVYLNRKTSRNVKQAVIEALRPYKKAVKSITYDNGTENVYHMKINKALGCQSYFCNPYHSWEKGTVEHINGMIRRYVKKSMDIADFSKKQIRIIQSKINNTPRKILSYMSAQEYFNKEWCSYG